MKPSLVLKMGQQLTMTPQLQQAIRLLQLSTLDLQQEIQEALESNPMLERQEEGEDFDNSDPMAESEQQPNSGSQEASFQETTVPTSDSEGIDEGEWHAEYLGKESRTTDTLLRRLIVGDGNGRGASTDLFGILAGRHQALLGQVAADAERLTKVQGMQAYCIECGSSVPQRRSGPLSGWLAWLLSYLG